MKNLLCAICMAFVLLTIAACGPENKTPVASGKAQTDNAAPQQSSEEAAAKAFVDQLVKGDFTQATGGFDSTMKAAMSAQQLQQAWNGLIAQVGQYQQQVKARTESVSLAGQQLKGVYVTTQFERATVDIKVVYNMNGQISGLWFVPPQG